jgi:hypothetical protein
VTVSRFIGVVGDDRRPTTDDRNLVSVGRTGAGAGWEEIHPAA